LECLILRDKTERPETITIGTNELIGTDPSKLPPALARLIAGQWKTGAIPPLWDGKAKERIVAKVGREGCHDGVRLKDRGVGFPKMTPDAFCERPECRFFSRFV
jgi:hypothetical protein